MLVVLWRAAIGHSCLLFVILMAAKQSGRKESISRERWLVKFNNGEERECPHNV
jgi:hypothetical protein